jgi:predicted MPP superfamily phosphohydrolase
MHLALPTVIGLFALLGHGYLWIGIVNPLHGWAGPHRLIDVLTLLVLLSFLILPPLIVWQWWLVGTNFLGSQYVSDLAEISRVYVVAIAFFGFGKLLAKFVGGWELDDPRVVVAKERRWVEPPQNGDFHKGRCSRLLSCVPGNQVLQLVIENKRLALPRLPEQLVGFRIAHVSDWHLTGKIDGTWFEHAAETVNSQEPDVVLVTGDLIENEACRPWLASSIGQLRAKHGVYFVLGNHDYYIDVEQTISQLEDAGPIYVGGKSIQIKWNGVVVTIIGNEVPWNRQIDDHCRTDDSFKVALVHTPDQFDWACQNCFDLVLAGHTHGGQVCFPVLGAVAAPSLYGTRMAGGTFCRGRTVMHVTRGISGETPMRWLCPPEIAILELVKG